MILFWNQDSGKVSNVNMMTYALVASLLVSLGLVSTWLFQVQRRWQRERSFYQNYPVAQVRVGVPEGNIIRCNEKFATTLGYATGHDCLLINQFSQHFPGLDLSLLLAKAKSAERLPFRVETVRMEQRDRLKVPMFVSVLGVESDRHLDLTIEQPENADANSPFMAVAQIKFDRSLAVISFNNAAGKLFGDTLLIGHSVTQFISQDYRARITRIMQKRMRHAIFSLPVPSIIAGGYSDRLNWSFVVQPWNEIELVCTRDATVPEDWRLLKTLVDGQIGLWELNLVTNGLSQSREWLSYLGYGGDSNGQLVSSWLSLVHPDDRNGLESQIEQVKNSGLDRINSEYRIAIHGGVEVTVSSIGYISQYSEKGSPVNLRGFHQVVSTTDEVSASPRVIQLGEFSHDLANQFASITGFAQLIREDADSQVANYAAQIQQAAEKAYQQLELQLHSQNPETGIYATVNRFCDDLGILSVVHLSPGKWIDIDDELITRCLIDITGNTLPPAFDAEKILVRTDFRRYPESICSYCNRQLDGAFFKLCIENRAHGSPRDHMLQRMDAGFYTNEIRRDTAVSENGVGSLSSMIHQSGGHVCVLTTVNKIEVSVFLPESQPDLATDPAIAMNTTNQSSPAVAQQRDDIQANKSVNILVLDDQPQICAYLREVLSREGYNVTVMMNAQQALDQFDQEPARFDLVITDQAMPDITGEQLIRQMHRIRPLLPIIICSGYSSPESEVLRRTGAAGYLRKPVNVARLLKLVVSSLKAANGAEEEEVQ